MTKEQQLVAEVRQLVLAVANEGVSPDMAEPEAFIAHYYDQEEALSLIKDRLFVYYPPKDKRKTTLGQLIETLQHMLRKRERDLVEFYDWGNPVALFIEKEATLAALKKHLMAVPLESIC